MEASAYGLGLLPEEFWDLTFHEFFLIQRGRNQKIEMTERFEWERTRWLACVMMQPHKKKGARLNPQDLVKFEWEKGSLKEINPEAQKKRAEYALKKYEAINKKNNG